MDFEDERIALACAFRWTARLDIYESVANHFSLAVDEAATKFLMNPRGRHFSASVSGAGPLKVSSSALHRVVIFNPEGNPNQVSALQPVNLGTADAAVRVTGIDDAAVLEAREEGIGGAFGDGIGKWRLRMESDEANRVLSLLRSPTGHLANLSMATSTPVAPRK